SLDGRSPPGTGRPPRALPRRRLTVEAHPPSHEVGRLAEAGVVSASGGTRRVVATEAPVRAVRLRPDRKSVCGEDDCRIAPRVGGELVERGANPVGQQLDQRWMIVVAPDERE